MLKMNLMQQVSFLLMFAGVAVHAAPSKFKQSIEAVHILDEPFNFPPEFERTLPTAPFQAAVDKRDTPNMNSDAFAKIKKETVEVDNINADNIDRSFHDLTGTTAGSFIQELVNNGGLANLKRNVDEASKRDVDKQTQTVNKRRARKSAVNNKNKRTRRDSRKTRRTRRQTQEDLESSRSMRALRRLRRATETLTGNIKSYAEDIKSMYDMSTEMYDKGTEMYEKMQQMTNNSNGGGGAQSEGCAAKPEATGAGDTGAAEAN